MVKLKILFILTMLIALSGCCSKQKKMTNLEIIKSTYEGKTSEENGKNLVKYAAEDISWTAFWTWAKTNGFANRDALEQAIGQSINQLSPGQARKLAQTVIDAR